MDKTSFGEEVYSVVASIPPGRVLTYGQIAYLIGKPQCSRMVGQAMHNAPEGQNLPCHRVVNSQGRLAPFWPLSGPNNGSCWKKRVPSLRRTDA